MSSKELEDGHFIDHFGCIGSELDNKHDCNSSDALAIYEHDLPEGEVTYSGFCWSCKQSFSPDAIAKTILAGELGMTTTGEVKERKPFERKPKQAPLSKEQVMDLIKGIGYTTQTYRSIRPETLRFFGHLAKHDRAGNISEIYYPETDEDNGNYPTGYKIRYLPKFFGKVGKTGIKSELSGQVKFPNGGKYLLITGGENDKTAAFQMLRDSQIARGQEDFDPIAVVSCCTGEASGYKQVAHNYDFCDKFDIIVVMMDGDEVGQEANKAIASVLPKEKVRIARSTLNDPHKMLEQGREKQFVRDFYGAKEFLPSEIMHSSQALQEAIDFLDCGKITLPPFLHKLQDNMRGGIKTTGAIINLIGDTSIGKSLFTDALLYYWFWNSPLVPTIVSLERTTGELTVDFLSMHLKNNLSWFKDGKEAIEIINDPKNQETVQDMLVTEDGESRYHVLDERSGSPDSLKACVERAYTQYDSKLIIFDPLTDFLRSLGTEAQEDFMMWQKQKKKEGVVFINVLHTRKPSPDKEGKIRKVTEYDSLGSGTFVQSADVNIVINRDKMAEDEIDRNTTEVDMPKCRGGTTGKVCDIYYDYKTRTLHDKEDYFSGVNPDNTALVSDF